MCQCQLEETKFLLETSTDTIIARHLMAQLNKAEPRLSMRGHEQCQVAQMQVIMQLKGLGHGLVAPRSPGKKSKS